jgi:hypothetical protein
MDRTSRSLIKRISKIFGSNSFSWLAPISIFLIGVGLIIAILSNPLVAVISVVIITILIGIVISILVYLAKNQLSSNASFDGFPDPEYITIDSKLTWIIENEEGTEARLEKTKKIRALRPISIIKEFWWGDGTPPGPTDFIGLSGVAKGVGRKYRQGSRWVVDLVMDKQYESDKVVEFGYVKRLQNPFTANSEWIESVASTETDNLHLSVIFPRVRHYKSARAVSRIGDLSQEYPLNENIGGETPFMSELTDDGREKLSWSVREPILGGVYTIEWDW